MNAVSKKLDMPQPVSSNFEDVFGELNNQESAKWGASHKVVYTSRTHSQLAQAMKELKVTEYRHLRGVALGSRDQLCINEDVLKDAATSSDKIHLCRAKIKAKMCSYHGRVEKALESPEVSNQSVLDIEDLVKVGKSCGACPYYMSKNLSGTADIVFLPYNYVLDPKLLKSFKLSLNNAIVILDEAHNVEKVCQDAASVQIASSDIATCVEDITHIMKALEKNEEMGLVQSKEDEVDFTIEDCAKLKEMMLALEQEIDSIEQVTSKGRTLPGGVLFDYLNAANITQETYPLVIKLIDSFLDFMTESSAGKVFARKGFGLAKINELLGTAYGSLTNDVQAWKQTMERGYRVHVELEEPKKKWTAAGKSSDGWTSNTSIQTTINNNAKVINFWCFNPGFGMANLINREVHSIILTSGTLAPLKPLISELALDVDYQLENPHIIKPSQVLARIISQGPDGTPLNASFNNRDNPKYIHSIGLTIKIVASFTPNGLLVFFPSYTLMNKMQEIWERSGMWKMINDVKPIFCEPKRKDEFDTCMDDYYTAVNISRGAIFMAVLRGKVSEGLDFKDQNGRAVIVIGLPFPPYLDPRVVLKKEYLQVNRTQKNQLQSGQDWYNMEATRAVNQAIGRVIRHKDDYGAILLCDQRFHTYKAGLSRWVQAHIKPQTGNFVFGPIIKELNLFFRNAAATLPVPVDVKKELMEEHASMPIKVEDLQTAKVKSDKIMKNQIKIENSNEIYGNGSQRTASMDYKFVETFLKEANKKEEPTSFFGGLSQDISTIDFNTTDIISQGSSSSLASLKPSQKSPEEYETANKKRKLTMVPNKSQPVTFVMIKHPVKVKREHYETEVPENRAALLEIVSRLENLSFSSVLKLSVFPDKIGTTHRAVQISSRSNQSL